jgi:undecaprenyl-diphosphatase
MDIVDAIILGIIQGLTEFLPVSSSGHLEIGREVLNADLLAAENLLFTIVLHFATALSTIIIFKGNHKYLFKIIISMIPAVLIGLFFEKEIEILFTGNITLVGSMLIITGILLLLTKISKEKKGVISYYHSFIIGISQAFAIIPGISRSGATICTSLLLGNNKKQSAKFSFLMVIPLIFGKIIKDLSSNNIAFNNIDYIVYIFGFISAFITGLFACKLMLKIVKNNSLNIFSGYCIILGLISIIITSL